jgi:hypothetical protein
MTGFVREIMHEIILNQILFVNIILRGTVEQKTIDHITGKKQRRDETMRYYIKTRPKHVDKTSRTSMDNNK